MATFNGMESIDELYFDKEMQRDKTTWEITTQEGTPVAKGLIQQDELNFSISNQYGTGSGDIISNTLKGIHNQAKQYSAYVNTGVNNLQGVINSPLVKSVLGLVNAGAQATWDALGGKGDLDFSKFMNGSFLTPADLVKIFQATNINIVMPKLHSIVFHRNGKNCMDYLTSVVKNVVGDVTSIGSVLGYQEAPNGYEPDLQVLNRSAISTQGAKGTYIMRWGYMTLHSILISSVSWTQSKFQAMEKDGSASGDPLYIEFEWEIELSTTVLKDDMLNLIQTMQN